MIKKRITKKRKIPIKKKIRRPPREHVQWKGVQKGRFTPRHPEKYKGNVNNIVYRSSWERSFMYFLDNNASIKEWGSETIAIPYRKPTTGRIHKYYPDFWVKYVDKNGKTIQEIIEIKPAKQTRQPTTVGKSKKTQLYESVAWSINVAKWKSAKLFCDKYGIKWRIMTEREIFK